MRYATLFLLTVILLTGGCAHYEYDLLQPAKLHAGTKEAASAKIDPLRYDLITVENQLVMMIHNPTEQPIVLQGDKSYVIEPSGRSCYLRGMSIAPGSYAKYIFPPPKPYVQDPGGFRIGVGTNIETAGGFRNGAGMGGGYETGGPQPVRNLDESYYWTWDGEGTVKFHFVFLSNDKDSFTHDLVIQRTKM